MLKLKVQCINFFSPSVGARNLIYVTQNPAAGETAAFVITGFAQVNKVANFTQNQFSSGVELASTIFEDAFLVNTSLDPIGYNFHGKQVFNSTFIKSRGRFTEFQYFGGH